MITVRSTAGLVAVAATAWAQCAESVRADAYSDAVLALNPTHYYRLNETAIGTVTDVGSSPIHGTHEGNGDMPPNPMPPVADVAPDYMGTGYVGAPGPDIVYKFDGTTVTEIPLPGFDANNRSLFANGGLAVNLGPARGPGGETLFAHTTMTLATWFKVTADPNAPGQVEQQFGVASQGGERLWTNNFDGQDLPGSSALDTSDVDDLGHLQIDLGAGANLIISLDNRFGGEGQELISNYQIPHRDTDPESGFAVKDNSWHHLVVSRNGDDIFDTILVIDGEHITTDRYADSTDSWGITEPLDTRIGTRTTAPHHQTFNGWIDELAIWINRQLTVEEAIGLWQAATGQGPALMGDYNSDGKVDAADYVVWRKNNGSQSGYDTWRTNFGRTAGSGSGAIVNAAIPEPTTGLVLLLLTMAFWICGSRRWLMRN
jgi:hypothetical protein